MNQSMKAGTTKNIDDELDFQYNKNIYKYYDPNETLQVSC